MYLLREQGIPKKGWTDKVHTCETTREKDNKGSVNSDYLKSWYRAKKYRVEGLGDSSVRKKSDLPAVTKGERPLYLLSDSSFSGKVTQSFVVTLFNKR